MTKTCLKCGAEKPVSEFSPHKRCQLGLQPRCKSCRAESQKSYRKRHPDKVKESLRKWHAKHPSYERDRAARRWRDPEEQKRLKAAHRKWGRRNLASLAECTRRYRMRKFGAEGRGLTVEQVAELLAQPCFYCGDKSVEVDHVVPLSRGGAHDIDNAVPCCRSCNASKAGRTITEWRPRFGEDLVVSC